jgi:transposase
VKYRYDKLHSKERGAHGVSVRQSRSVGTIASSIEEYVGKEDPVRAYDAFVESVDLADLGIEIDEHQVGNSEYDPRAMLKLLVYGYSYGIKESRKLERATHHNLSFIWLMGGLKPDHKTIAEFRRQHTKRR